MKKLHPNQKKLLELLRRRAGDPPTMEEMAREMEISSKSVIHYHIKQLEKKGLLTRGAANAQQYYIKEDESQNVVYLPLYGMAKCGPAGTILDGSPSRVVPVDPSMVKFPACKGFMVEAKGDSMTDLIHPKDWLIVEQNNCPRERDVIVCSNNGETLVKRFITDKGGNVLLVSDNNAYSPIVADRDSFKVDGIVRSILKRDL
ncbi:MAG: helix-turn-helix domain-containing protein [Elusimicrobiota bacterium]|jgi:repressor LexA|nr:helix-turn-helix domain-containing protein [Elusimicrobiota bacterium]